MQVVRTFEILQAQKITMEKKTSEDHSVPAPIADNVAAIRTKADIAGKKATSAAYIQAKQAKKVRPNSVDAVHRFGKNSGNR